MASSIVTIIECYIRVPHKNKTHSV